MLDKIELIAQNAIRIENARRQVIYFDPYKLGGNTNDADYIFITHSHYDHFSPQDISKIKKDTTKIVVTSDLEAKTRALGFDSENILVVMPNEDYQVGDIHFSTIPAYNLKKEYHKREFNWVGYIVKIDDDVVYVAGDTDNTPEAQKVECDVAFVPVGGIYTMNCIEAVDLIAHIYPKIAIPTHYKTIVGSEQDAIEFKKRLENDIKVEILM